MMDSWISELFLKPHRLHRVHNANALGEITDPFIAGKQSSVM